MNSKNNRKHPSVGTPKADEVPEIPSSYQFHVEIDDLIQERHEKLLKLESTFALVTTLSEED